MRQTVLIAVVATLLIASAPHTAKAFLPIGIAIGAGMVGGAMQDESSRKQQSEQSEQYQRSQSATERKPKKKTTKAKNQKPNDAFAKESPPKAKSHESVANAPQAKPLTAGAPPTPDKFGE